MKIPIEKIMMIHIPKNAGMSMQSVLGQSPKRLKLRPHSGWGDKAFRERWRALGEPPLVACVRNPYSRAASIYGYFRKQTNKWKAHSLLRHMCRRTTLSDFWEHADIQSFSKVLPHFRTQNSFIEGAPLTILARMENLEEDWAKIARLAGIEGTALPRINTSSAKAENLSSEAKQRIRKIYSADFDNYYPDLK